MLLATELHNELCGGVLAVRDLLLLIRVHLHVFALLAAGALLDVQLEHVVGRHGELGDTLELSLDAEQEDGPAERGAGVSASIAHGG